MDRPIVMCYTRGDDYKTYVVISVYDTLTFHGTELPEGETLEMMTRFFNEAEHAAYKKFEEDQYNTDIKAWEEKEPETKSYTGD